MDQVVVLVGTETGNAEDLAGELAVTLEGAGAETEVVDMEDAYPGLLNGSRAVVVCTATTGLGDLPENSIDFFEALGEEWPDLGGVLFCVCSLGDSIYPDFCEAGRIWSRFLADLGATEVVEWLRDRRLSRPGGRRGCLRVGRASLAEVRRTGRKA